MLDTISIIITTYHLTDGVTNLSTSTLSFIQNVGNLMENTGQLRQVNILSGGYRFQIDILFIWCNKNSHLSLLTKFYFSVDRLLT